MTQEIKAEDSETVAPRLHWLWVRVPARYEMVPMRCFKWDRKKKELVEVIE